MGVYLGSIELGGGGASIPEAAIFTTSGTWTVPQSVQDEIASEGHAEVIIFMVGGGTTAGSGEIVLEHRLLTTADYDDPNAANPTIAIQIGAEGGFTGFTGRPTSAFTETLGTHTDNGLLDLGSANFVSVITDGTASFDANGYPLINSFTMPSATTGSSDSVRSPISLFQNNLAVGTAFGNAPTIDQSTRTATWANPEPFTGTLTATYIRGGASANNVTISWDATREGWKISNSSARTGSSYAQSGASANMEGGAEIQNRARSGSDASHAEFLNLRTDTQGYFGGWARFNGQKPNSGSGGTSPQSGYLQILYS